MRCCESALDRMTPQRVKTSHPNQGEQGWLRPDLQTKLMECAERRRSIGNGQTTFVIRGMKDTCIVENEIEKALMTAKRTLEQDNMV